MCTISNNGHYIDSELICMTYCKGCYNGFIAYWKVVHGSYGSYLRSRGLECSKNRSILATHRSYGRECIAESALQSRAKIYRHYPSGKRLLDGQLLNIVE